MQTSYSLEHTMPSIPHIKKSDIARWTDEVYFQRGQKYYDREPFTNSVIKG